MHNFSQLIYKIHCVIVSSQQTVCPLTSILTFDYLFVQLTISFEIHRVQDLFVHNTKTGALMAWIWFSRLTSLELQI